MARVYLTVDEVMKKHGVDRLVREIKPDLADQTQRQFQFIPARPANLLITRDPISGELNMSGGTFGALTEKPYTLCLHSQVASFDATRNTTAGGGECVVALPGRDIVTETWFSALPLPRGIFEGDVAGLTLLPSQVIDVPGIAECAVNLECRIEFVKKWYSHYVLFLRVVAASVEEDLLTRERLEIVQRFPTYEADDQPNEFGGVLERLSTIGELLDCPGFPVGPKRGSRASTSEWIEDLREASHLSDPEAGMVLQWLAEWDELPDSAADDQRGPRRERITRALELAAWEEWPKLRDHLAAAQRV